MTATSSARGPEEAVKSSATDVSASKANVTDDATDGDPASDTDGARDVDGLTDIFFDRPILSLVQLLFCKKLPAKTC